MIDGGFGLVENVWESVDVDNIDDWAACKRKGFIPVGNGKGFLESGEASAATAE